MKKLFLCFWYVFGLIFRSRFFDLFPSLPLKSENDDLFDRYKVVVELYSKRELLMSIRKLAIVALSIYGFSAHAEMLSLTQHPWSVMTERQGPFSFKKECLIQAARDASVAYSSHHASSETEKVLPLEESEYNPGYVLVRRQGSVVDIVLTFKGTSNLWDGLTDITLPMVHCAEIEGDGDRVHRGFHSR